MVSGSYAERIRESRPRLSKSFQRLADYILDSYVQAALMTASELAHEVDVDAATVVRFAQTLDYDGFPELQDEIRGRVLEDLMLRPREAAADTLRGQTERAFNELGEAIERARKLIDPAPMEKLLQAIGQAKRVFILADAGAQFAVDDMMRHLQAIGSLVFKLQLENIAVARMLSTASEGDLLLTIDLNDNTPLISAALAQAKTASMRSAAIVGGGSFEAARRAEIVLEVQRQEQNEAMSFVLSALIHALGSAMRWRFAEKYREQQQKADRVLRRLTAARPAR